MKLLCLTVPSLLFVAALGACGSEDANPTADAGALADADQGSPDAALNLLEPGALLGSYDMTFYWLAFEDDFSGGPTETLYQSDCSALAQVTTAFADSLRLEGSGRLSDGRVLNYDGSCGCNNSPCFFEVEASAPWGLGVQNRILQPFRSLAVDTSDLSIGQTLYIEELDGLLMPGDGDEGGYLHDGCVVADDVGGAINGNHIDFFSGLRSHYLVLDPLVNSATVSLHEGGERCPMP